MNAPLSVYPRVSDNDGASNLHLMHLYGTRIYNECSQRKGRRLTGESRGMENGGGTTVTGMESLSVKDNRTGKGYDIEVKDGTVRAMDFQAGQGRRGGLRPDDLRPWLLEHGELPERHHLHRWGEGHPAAPGHPYRAAL